MKQLCRRHFIVAAMLMAATPVLAQIGVVGEPTGTLAGSRLRIVPQSSDGLLQDIEESLDGTRLLTHDRGYAPRLWDAKRQILLRVLTGHPDQVYQVTFSPDGKYVLTASATILQVWDSLRAKLVSSIRTPEKDGIWCAAFSPDGARVAVGYASGSVTVLTTTNPLDARPLGKHDDGIWTVAWNPTATHVVSLCRNGNVSSWNVATGSRVDLTAHKETPKWASFSPDGKLVVTSGNDDTALVSEVETGKLIAKYANVVGSRSVDNVQMGAQFAGPNNAEVVCAAANGDLNLYKPGVEIPVAVMRGHTEAIRELRRSRDGRYLATYAGDETLRLWDTHERKELPFNPEEGSPTAGEFSPHSPIWWLGYSEGQVRQYDIRTGKATRSTFGAVTTLGAGRLLSDSMLWLRSRHEGSIWGGGEPAQHLFLRPEGGANAKILSADWSEYEFSPNGRYVAYTNRSNEGSTHVLDLWQDKPTVQLDRVWSIAFSPDSAYVALTREDRVTIWEAATGASVHQAAWPIDPDVGGIAAFAFHPDGVRYASAGHPGHMIAIWNAESSKTLDTFGPFKDLIHCMKFTPDGKYLLVLGWTKLVAYEVGSGEEVAGIEHSGEGEWFHDFTLSTDGSRAALVGRDTTAVVTVPDLESLIEVEGDGPSDFCKDGKKLITVGGSTLALWDVDKREAIVRILHPDKVVQVQFAAGESRIVAVDGVGGATVWDATPTSLVPDGGAGKTIPKKLASVVLMKSGDWLVYDDEGRFDASDPSRITGAYFVLDWPGGLEAIAMSQLKSQFYEPGLLAKVLRTDTDPVRDVPSLSSLRLYPELTVRATNKPGVYDIQCKERDEGGIGRVTVYLNGKQVLAKKSSAYVQFDTSEYSAYLLPATHLPPGTGNTLSVTVSNERGDLTSSPVEVDLGIPPDLVAPDVRLYGLLVGVGDYVGTSTDLLAPPSDASGMAQALTEVASRLLPGRAKLTVLTAGKGSTPERPTRERIMAWFAETAKTARSTDIVIVFLAGHGVSKIGQEAGYFFLTSEANPADVGPGIIGTATISAEDLRTSLAAIPANKQIVVLDTCHSGAAAESLLDSSRSVSGDYQRAWESIKDATGTWLLAGSAADQKSYESGNVDHGLLTYALLEAIDRATAAGLREASTGEYFVDVERWLSYAANRVESLKAEVGLKGVQKPEFRKAARGTSFDVGVMTVERRGFLGLAAPKPVVIVGTFEMEEEDPVGLETAVQEAMRDSRAVKAWFDVQKHPGVYRVAGTYSIEGDQVRLKVYVQRFDEAQSRKTLQTFDLSGPRSTPAVLASQVRDEIEKRLKALSVTKPAA